jgi:putative transcriptional regulator
MGMITYAPLWETMKQRHITTYALIKNYAFSRGTLDSLKHNRNITTATRNDLCRILSCRVEDVLLYIPDEAEES